MAGTQRPSFLKRQKEQKRLGRALEKRQARQARRDARSQSAESGAAGAGMPDDAKLGVAGDAADAPAETDAAGNA